MKSFDLAWLGLTAPLNITALGGLIVLLLESFSATRSTMSAGEAAPKVSRSYLGTVTLIILLLAGALELRAWTVAETPQVIYNGMLVVDRWSVFLGGIFFTSAILATVMADSFMREHRFEFGEFYALVLLSTTGMLIIGHASDLVSLFIGIETMSLGVYVLAGSWRHSAKSSEAAMKYFLVGAFASAVMLYGIVLVYGAAGTTSLPALARPGTGMVPATIVDDPIFLAGGLLVIVGLGFKVAAVPFHMWLPDTYEGAPTPVTAYMAAGVKAAGFAAVVRFFATGLAHPSLAGGTGGWTQITVVLAVLTMTLGNLAALRQDNVKRMLAYSSIAHAGYILVGVAAMSTAGADARGPILYYLLAYTFTTVGSFAVVAWFGSRGDERQHIDDWAGMASRHPAAALAMLVFLLSLAGFPPTAGFFGKFYMFKVAVAQPGLVPLVVIAVLNSLVSYFYYLRVVAAMYFRELGREPTPMNAPGMTAALVLSAVGTMALGMFPSWIVDLCGQATMFLPK